MMKIKILFLKLFLFFIILSGNSFAKNIPPGSGIADVPANVLILLDKSGSMNARMVSGSGFYYPQGVAADGNGNVYAGQISTRGIKKILDSTKNADPNWGRGGIYFGSGQCRAYYVYSMEVHGDYLYAVSYYGHSVFRVHTTTGVCDYSERVRYAYNLAIGNNKLYAFGRYRNYTTWNLSGAKPSKISCSVSVNYWLYYESGSAVDPSGNYYYAAYGRNLYRHKIDNNGCITNSYSVATLNSYYMNRAAIRFHPTNDNILYAASMFRHRLTKITLDSSSFRANSYKSVGRCCRGKSNATRQYFYYPYGVAIDKTNNRVWATSYYTGSAIGYDLDLNFYREYGGSSGTRMSGAHEAIKAVVTDSSLTAGVNFGFGYWAWSGRAGFKNWIGDITNGRAIPCTYSDCIKVRAHKQGAQRINREVSRVSAGGGTNALDWAKQAEQYYLHNRFSPIDKALTCQNSYVLVIGDGQWAYHNNARQKVINLFNRHKIKTFTVAYGGGLSGSGINNFRNMAIAGGTKDVIIANTTASLKSQLKAAISQIIASKLSFTAPAITATVTEGGSLFQAQFDYEQNKEWRGTLTRTAIDSKGNLDTTDSKNWSAIDKLPAPDKRKIWSPIPGTDYKTDYNNFIDTNWAEINSIFGYTGNEVSAYHNKTFTAGTSSYPSNTTRCASTSGVENDADDDVKGLINFIRGTDYFDYDGDCNLTETRVHPLGDIYHSEMVVIGKPSAETAFTSSNQESYYRSLKNYDSFAQTNSTRKEVIYVGANDGMLHAFDAETGKELWGFVPPFVATSLPSVVNVNLNRATGGGSNAIYGVDGSVTAHDMYFKSPLGTTKAWHTILMVPYGRGGNGFSVLDVTKPDKPLHLYSVLNDTTLKRVHVMDHNQNISSFDYLANSYPLSSLPQAIQAKDNAEAGTGSQTCAENETFQCFKSKKWALPSNLSGISKSDLQIIIDDKSVSFSVGTYSSGSRKGQSYIQLTKDVTYYGYDPADNTKNSTSFGLYIKPGSKLTGVQTQPLYDYSGLGETWSAPRIIRIPNNGAGDVNVEDDRYVAIMGGGFGAQHQGTGSNLFLIDLENTTLPGAIYKVLQIEDLTTNDIVNSTPGSPVVITPDTARGVNYRGALVYLNDLEGKITKFNLTNMSDDGAGTKITQFDSTTLFTAGSSASNGRYMYHSMDATIGQTTNSLWLYAGTGDYERIGDTTSTNNNMMFGIADPDYPLYRNIATATKAADLSKCKNTTKDASGASCPQLPGDVGWYISLENSQKVSAEPTVSSGLVYFPIYQPSSSVNKCSLGDAFICGVDDECGTNFSYKLGGLRNKTDVCKYVGQGVLSRIVVFADKLFANIAGQSTGKKKDLVTLDAAAGGTTGFRSSWRQNY